MKESGEARGDYYLEAAKLLEARAAEISYFTKYLRLKGKMGSRLLTQTLPKHMRRRAMSHNRFRVPSRVRARLKESTAKPKKKIRRTGLSRAGFRRRLFRGASDLTLLWRVSAGDCALLETHRFLAKRCVMAERAGTRVAARSKSKQHRTVWRFLHTNRVVEDKSYFHFCLADFAASEALHALAAKFPGSVVTVPVSATELLVLADPLLVPAMPEAWRLRAWERGAGVLNLFEVCGPKAFESLDTLLKWCLAPDEDLPQVLSHGLQPAQLPDGLLFVLDPQVPAAAVGTSPFRPAGSADQQEACRLLRRLWAPRAPREEPRQISDRLQSLAAARRGECEFSEQRTPFVVVASPLPDCFRGQALSRLYLIGAAGRANKVLKALLNGSAKLVGCEEKQTLLAQLGHPPLPAACLPRPGLAHHRQQALELRLRHSLRLSSQRPDYLAQGVMLPLGVELDFFVRPDSPFTLCRFVAQGAGRIRYGATVFVPLEEEERLLRRPRLPRSASLLEKMAAQCAPPRIACDFARPGPAAQSFSTADELAQRLRSECRYAREAVGQVLHSFFSFRAMRTAGWLFVRLQPPPAPGRTLLVLSADHAHLAPVTLETAEAFEAPADLTGA